MTRIIYLSDVRHCFMGYLGITFVLLNGVSNKKGATIHPKTFDLNLLIKKNFVMEAYMPHSTGDTYDTDFKFQAHSHPSNHTAHLKGMADRYELWILLPDISLYNILVFKEAETIKVYQKDKLKKQPDVLLEQFTIPDAIKSKMIRVKEFDYGINIIMPKRLSEYASTLSALPVEF